MSRVCGTFRAPPWTRKACHRRRRVPTPRLGFCRSWRRDLLRAAPPRALRSGQEGAHQSFDNEDDLDKGLAQELDRLVNPQRAQKTANHLELMWKISGTRVREVTRDVDKKVLKAP
eukprot:365990-Chlamydomonas_euryale.AAC.11